MSDSPLPPPHAGEAFGVYVHWPFCLSKCPYCDFNSHVRHGGIDEARFVRAFETEIAATAARAPGRTVSTIFFGGGTPSLMAPATTAAILDAIGQHWTVAPDVEVTLEANPTSVEATRFRGFRAAGVNRVSLGVQALDDAALKELGRLHTAREALDAVAIARANFERYSFDLIYARVGQTPAAWRAELARAIDEAAEHLSLYQLTIEQDTPFAALHAAGKLIVPDDDVARAPLRRHAGGHGGARACRLRDLQPRTAGRRMPPTISSTGAITNMPASGRARTAGSWSTARGARPRPRSVRRPGSRASRPTAMAW